MTESQDSGQSTANQNGPSGRPSQAKRWARAVVRWVIVLAVAAGFLAAYWMGFSSGLAVKLVTTSPAPTAPTADTTVWTCSMHPQIRQPQPGNCPICGMQLIPEAEPAGSLVQKKAKYACAMFCVPPMERPGKCPICGMEMVAVDTEDGLAGGGQDDLEPWAITLSPQAMKLAELDVTRVIRRFVDCETRMVGKVDFDESRVRSITSRVPGRLDRLYVDFTGIVVREGDHLVHLYSPELLVAQEELLQAAQAFAESETGLLGSLREIRAVSLEDARVKLRLWGLTEEQIAGIERRGTASDHLTIYAPIGGIVIEKLAVEGMYVETGTPIYTIADLTRLWVKLDAYESDLGWIHYGQEVTFETEAYPGETFHGRIAFIDPVLNDRTRTVKIRVNVDNADGRLKPEMFVRAVAVSRIAEGGEVLGAALTGKWICPMHPEIVKSGPETCDICEMALVTAESLGYASASSVPAKPPLVIPATAPLITGKRGVVYVAREDLPGRYEGREVRLGPRAGDYYLVAEGLKEGELVVSRGGLFLDSAVQILARRSMMQTEVEGSSTPPDQPGHAHHASESEHGAPPSAEQRDPNVDVVPWRESKEVQSALDALIDSYLAVHRGLSHDQLDAAHAAAAEFVQTVENSNAISLPSESAAEWQSMLSQFRTSAEGLLAPRSMEVARAAFEGVSNSLISLTKRAGTGKRRRLLVYHCPMAFDHRGASWLQEKEGVENPYFGAAMFRCGVLKESVETAAVDGETAHD